VRRKLLCMFIPNSTNHNHNTTVSTVLIYIYIYILDNLRFLHLLFFFGDWFHYPKCSISSLWVRYYKCVFLCVLVTLVFYGKEVLVVLTTVASDSHHTCRQISKKKLKACAISRCKVAPYLLLYNNRYSCILTCNMHACMRASMLSILRKFLCELNN
jgi:hypothetical protein